ncbi:MAG: alpha/beta hydrolase [Verrucomicrobiales bacterium]
MRTLKRLVIVALCTVAAFALVCLGTLYFAQESMIYFPRAYSSEEIAWAGERAQEISFRTTEGEQKAFFLGAGPGEQLPGRIWLLFGGNASCALDWIPLLDLFGIEDAGFLMIDYPGYGLCEGRPGPQAIAASTEAAVAALAGHLGVEQGEMAGRFATLGHSLGAAAALGAAEHFGIEPIVLLSPFTSLKDMAARIVGRPFSNLLRHDYDNRARVERLLVRDGVQLTILHGSADTIIPLQMGEALADLEPERIDFHAIEGAGHNDIARFGRSVIAAAMR